jgi:hypothetical protein
MISTEIYIENYQVDLVQDISTDFTYTIDDINDFGAKNTSFSKTISLPGTANNNKVFGFVFDLGNSNVVNDALPNVNSNFNAAKTAQCRILIDKIQIFKGVIRLLEIVNQSGTIEYQCNVNGDLGGFVSELANKRLEDLDFSDYDENWTFANITSSWDSVSGEGVFYPLIDIGSVSSGGKTHFQYKAFKPALYVKEYLEKIIAGTDYTWEFPLLETDLMKRLIIPCNQKTLQKFSNITLAANPTANTYNNPSNIHYTATTLGNFTLSGSNQEFTYTPATAMNADIVCSVAGQINSINAGTTVDFYLYKNAALLSQQTISVPTTPMPFNIDLSVNGITFNQNDILRVGVQSNVTQIQQYGGQLQVISTLPLKVDIQLGDEIDMNYAIPRGIFQRDFFISICKMFNLYVYDDQFDEKKLYIKPYIDFYDGTTQDWTNKVDRSKAWSIKPMSELNSRYYQFKYKPDNDFYNENYRKRFNEGYGDYIFDSEYEFANSTNSTEVIFSGTPLYQATGTDKIYPAIYKKSNDNAAEDPMDFNIRILQAQKITGRTTWKIENGNSNLGNLNVYGYAGHLQFNNSLLPLNDINFGAPNELFFTAESYPTTNLFNAYYSDYMAEITDKDSKLLTCQVLLNSLDILQLDFSKMVWIDGILFRINKVLNYNPMNYTTTKVELLKVIQKTF